MKKFLRSAGTAVLESVQGLFYLGVIGAMLGVIFGVAGLTALGVLKLALA